VVFAGKQVYTGNTVIRENALLSGNKLQMHTNVQSITGSVGYEVLLLLPFAFARQSGRVFVGALAEAAFQS